MDEQRLSEIEQRVKAVPEAELEAVAMPTGKWVIGAETIDGWLRDPLESESAEQYATLFAHAPTDLEDMMEEVKRLHGEVNRLTEDLRRVCEAAYHALYHIPPNGCWVTGPLTGVPFDDLVACPGCRAIAIINDVMPEVSQHESVNPASPGLPGPDTGGCRDCEPPVPGLPGARRG